MNRTEVRQLLQQLDLRPSKVLGQCFLVDHNILPIILKRAELRPDETVIEIGPGLGMLTRELIRLSSRQVIAIEKDHRLCGYLRDALTELELVEADAIKYLDTGFRPPPPYKLVANLPYSISTPVLERFVEGDPKPRSIVVTLQREVARRLAAHPRNKDYGALTVLTQLHYHVTIVHVVSPHCFYPEPKVESAIVALDRRDPRVQLETGAPFHRIVRLGFGQRRKTLKKLIATCGDVEGAFERLGISLKARAEELSLEDWIRLANELKE